MARRLKLHLGRGQKRPRFISPLLRQTGSRRSREKDKSIKALGSGKRVSRRGRIYWETRKNRSDYEDDL